MPDDDVSSDGLDDSDAGQLPWDATVVPNERGPFRILQRGEPLSSIDAGGSSMPSTQLERAPELALAPSPAMDVQGSCALGEEPGAPRDHAALRQEQVGSPDAGQ